MIAFVLVGVVIGFLAHMLVEAHSKARRDTRSMQQFSRARPPTWTPLIHPPLKHWPPHHNTEDERFEMECQDETRRDAR